MEKYDVLFVRRLMNFKAVSEYLIAPFRDNKSLNCRFVGRLVK